MSGDLVTGSVKMLRVVRLMMLLLIILILKKVDTAKCNLFRRQLLSNALVDCQCPRFQKTGKVKKSND